MASPKIIIPLPHQDFDPTEASVPWKLLKVAGFDVVFATADGERAYTDPLMLSGQGLDPWGWIPLLKKLPLLGLILRADQNGRTAYYEMEKDYHFLNPIKFSSLSQQQFDGIMLPGGHAEGMRPYLENKTLQTFVANFFDELDDDGNHKPVAAICHGVLVAARSISSKTHKSVLFGKKTTALPWKMEKSAWDATKFFGRFWDPNYYRTYLEQSGEEKGYQSVEQEIKRVLESDDDFIDSDKSNEYVFIKSSGFFRDTEENSKPAWIVKDGNYISGRWPGDAHTFTKTFIKLFNR